MIPTQTQALIDTATNPDDLFRQLMPAIAQWLNCDRCFLYLRDPQTRLGRVPFCWTRHTAVPTVYDNDWKPVQTCPTTTRCLLTPYAAPLQFLSKMLKPPDLPCSMLSLNGKTLDIAL